MIKSIFFFDVQSLNSFFYLDGQWILQSSPGNEQSIIGDPGRSLSMMVTFRTSAATPDAPGAPGALAFP